MSRVARLLMACLWLAALGRAADDELAGEKEELKRPVARPTVDEPEGSAFPVSRSARAPQAPSFELPEFVITSGGERKALSSRGGLSAWMDTSGGIKASPTEAEASKSQLGSVGERVALEGRSETARPAYGEARIVYGLQNTFDGSAFYGQERGPWWWIASGEHGFSDGGPSGIPVWSINQSKASKLGARAGWRFEPGLLSGGGSWASRDRLLTRAPLPAPRIERTLAKGDLAWQSGPRSELTHALRFGATEGQVRLPGLGTAYTETLLELRGSAEKELLTRQSRTVIQASAYLGDLCQNRGDRVPLLAGGEFMARMEAWKGGRLSLGLGADWIGRGVDGLLVAPLAAFEQRLGRGWGVWARLRPGMRLSTLQGGLFEKDPSLPSARSLPERDRINVEAGLSAALPWGAGLELKGGFRQNEDALFLDDPSGVGLWTETNVRLANRGWASMDLTAGLGEFRPSLGARWQNLSLPDSPGLSPTFAPAWTGKAGLDWASEPWSAGIALVFSAEREGRLAGGDTLPASWDLRLNGEWELSREFSLLVEARNLLASRVAEFSGHADPAPFAGAGARWTF